MSSCEDCLDQLARGETKSEESSCKHSEVINEYPNICSVYIFQVIKGYKYSFRDLVFTE